MKITIIRAECSKYGQDGVLYINNNPVCDTCEHPERKLPAGEYCLEMGDDFFKHKIRVHLKNKPVKLTKKKLKKAVDAGDTEIIARTSNYEVIHF